MGTEKSKYCGCLYYTSNAFARMMTKMAEEEFAPTGLAPSYAFLLMSVNEQPGIQPMELSKQMQLTPSTVTRLIEKMEIKGMVERCNVGRATQVYPTPKSKSIDKDIRRAWNKLYERYEELLGKKEASQLTQVLYDATLKLDS